MNVKILGSNFEIMEVSFISHGGMEIGMADYINQTIQIKAGMHPEKKKITLLHEILHSILEQLGFNKECEDEQLICTLSTTLIQLFNDNPAVTSYLFPCLKT